MRFCSCPFLQSGSKNGKNGNNEDKHAEQFSDTSVPGIRRKLKIVIITETTNKQTNRSNQWQNEVGSRINLLYNREQC